MVHWSALARWEETKAARRRQRYQPRNLLAALQSVQDDKTPVVGLDGEPTSLLGLYKATAAQDKAAGAASASAAAAAEREWRGQGWRGGAGAQRWALTRAGCRPHPPGRDTRQTRPLLRDQRSRFQQAAGAAHVMKALMTSATTPPSMVPVIHLSTRRSASMRENRLS